MADDIEHQGDKPAEYGLPGPTGTTLDGMLTVQSPAPVRETRREGKRTKPVAEKPKYQPFTW